jgi:membrane-associated phospholipid phosphatase
MYSLNEYTNFFENKSEEKEGYFRTIGGTITDGFLSVPRDFSQMGKTLSSNWKRTAIYTGSIIGLIATDKYTTGFLHNKIEPNIDYTLPNISFMNESSGYNLWLRWNNAYMTYPVIGLYLGSLATNYKKGQVTVVNTVKAMGYSYLVSHLFMKTAFARNRPHRSLKDDIPEQEPWTRNNWDFFNFHKVYFFSRADGTSFVSYHATTYFAMAKVFQMEFNNYWIPYTFATFIFMADMKSHNHWVSDLVAGALVGTVIGKAVVESSRIQMERQKTKSQNKKNVSMKGQWIPSFSNSYMGLQFVGNFQ